jgi:ABC-type sugar transport system permease subunit
MAAEIEQEYEAPADGTLDRVRSTWRENRFEYLLVGPTVLFLVLVMWFPFVRGLYMSLHEWPFAGEITWIGLSNYTYLFTWDQFYTSLQATVVFGSTTLIQLVIALIASLVVVNLDEFKNLVSGAMLIPYTMPPVVTGLMWDFLLNPDFGPILGFPLEWGVFETPLYYASDGTLAMAAITLVTAWTFWPFMFVILTATLESIPSSHYETARVYGANRVQTFLRVTLPQLRSAILIVVSLRMIWNLAKVSQPLTMTGGGPGFQTSILGILLYRYTWQRGAFGLAYAVGVVLFLLTLSFVLIFLREFQRESVELRK